MKKRTVLPPNVLRADTQAFFDVLNDERDFAIVVVSAGYLDACLGALLRSRLRNSSVTERLLDPGRGAIGSLGVRADLAYAMDLVPKAMYQDLCTITQVRNMVAHHHFALSFQDEEVQRACHELEYLQTVKNGDLDELIFDKHRLLPPPRERFKCTVMFVLDFLLRQAEVHGPKSTEV